MPIQSLSISAGRPDREANGRKRRGGVSEYIVYIGQISGRSTVKVGRTHNAKQRVAQYERSGAGQFRFVAQMVVHSREDAKKLESLILNACRDEYQSAGREWFCAGVKQVCETAERVIGQGFVEVTECRGGIVRHTHEKAEYASRPARW